MPSTTLTAKIVTSTIISPCAFELFSLLRHLIEPAAEEATEKVDTERVLVAQALLPVRVLQRIPQPVPHSG